MGIKISELTAEGSLAESALVPVVQSGATRRSTVGAFLDLFSFARLKSLLAAASDSVGVNDQKITDVATPELGTDAANKDYVDTVAASIRDTFDTGDVEVNVPNNSITTLLSLDFDDLEGASGPFGDAGSHAGGEIIYKFCDLGVGDSGAPPNGDEMTCTVRVYVQRRNGGNAERVGSPELVSSKNFLHQLTFTDGNPFLARVTKNSNYDSTLRCRASGFLHTRTGLDP